MESVAAHLAMNVITTANMYEADKPGLDEALLASALDELNLSAIEPTADRKFAAFETRWLSKTGSGAADRDLTEQYLAGAAREKAGSRGSNGIGLGKATLTELHQNLAQVQVLPLIDLLGRTGNSAEKAASLFIAKFRETLIDSPQAIGSVKAGGVMAFARTVLSMSLGLSTSHDKTAGIAKETEVVRETNKWPSSPEMAGESGSDAGELDLQNGVADSLDRVVELLKTMLDVAREYAMDVVSLVEQYLDWVRVVRERMLGEARDQRRRQAVDLLLSRVDRVELGRNLGAMTVAVAAPAGGNPTASAATLYLPRFNDPGLDRCFQGMMAGLLAPAEGVAGEPAQAGLL